MATVSMEVGVQDSSAFSMSSCFCFLGLCPSPFPFNRFSPPVSPPPCSAAMKSVMKRFDSFFKRLMASEVVPA